VVLKQDVKEAMQEVDIRMGSREFQTNVMATEKGHDTK